MGFIKNLSLKFKLLLIAVPPLIIVGFYSILIIYSLIGQKSNLTVTKNRIMEAEVLAKAVHFMQIERGLSVGFIATKGAKNGDKLPSIRKKVDNAIDEVRSVFDTTNGDNSVLNTLNELSRNRSMIDSLSLAGGDVAPYYTKIILSFIDSAVVIPNLMDDKDGRNAIQAYTHLASAKESLGQIRAFVNKAFSLNTMNHIDYSVLIGREMTMNINKRKFETLAPQELKDFYHKHFKGEVVDETFGMLDIAKKKGLDGDFGIKADVWFTKSTATIDLLRDVEVKLYEDVYNLMDTKINNATMQIYTVAIIIIFSIAIGMLVTAALIKNTMFSINTIQNGLLSFFSFLNRETTKANLICLDSQDEFGQMAQVINENIQKTQKGIDEDNALIDDAKVVMARVKNGWYSQFIEKSSSNPTLHQFKNNVNEMINATRIRFVEVDEVLEEYTKHNYTVKLTMKDTDEKGGVLEKLVVGINSLQSSITQMLVENKSNGLTLDESSNILLANVDKLNQSSNEAAASLEETAAALEEMTSNIRNNTENIAKMASLSSSVTSSANKGEKLANQTTVAMEEINAQVTAINEAISVIDQIAFQTNILSLNAAVEAATAGEAGKGFAVVAQEVRNLAARSAEAAKEIKDIVERATSKANEGKAIANDMIQGYSELNKNISHTINLISDIEHASKEQLLGIEQINDAVTQLDQQTQQNAMVASQTHDVAVLTDEIAKLVVSSANEKEFIGKNEVKGKSTGLSSTQVKVPQVHTKPIVKKPAVPVAKTSHATSPKIQTITPTKSSNDEWEAF